MPLTLVQARDKNYINSLKDFMVTNIVTPYNTAVAGTNYPGPLGIMLEFPDDPLVRPVLPLIIMGRMTDSKGPEGTGMGDGTIYRHKVIRLEFYSALNKDGKSDFQADEVLRFYADQTFGALYIPIYDYSVNPAVLAESAEIKEAKLVNPRDHMDPVLNIMKNRFDYLITLKIAMVALNG